MISGKEALFFVQMERAITNNGMEHAARILARETYREAKKVITHTKAAPINASGFNAKIAPAAVETPLPPLNLR